MICKVVKTVDAKKRVCMTLLKYEELWKNEYREENYY